MPGSPLSRTRRPLPWATALRAESRWLNSASRATKAWSPLLNPTMCAQDEPRLQRMATREANTRGLNRRPGWMRRWTRHALKMTDDAPEASLNGAAGYLGATAPARALDGKGP